MSSQSTSQKKPAPKKRNLIVNYIPSHLKEEQLFELFAFVGSIQSLRIMRNADGTGKGYGFVEYQDHVSAAKAIVQFDGLQLGKKKLKVAFARPGGSREGCNLFVKNIPSTWTTEKLTQEFGKFGELLESRVLATNDFQSRRCGFVRFDLPRDAFNAMNTMNGYIPKDGDFQIKVTYATKRRGRHGSFEPAPAPNFERPIIARDNFQQYPNGKRDDRPYTNYIPPTLPPFPTPPEQSYDAFRAPFSKNCPDYIDAPYPGRIPGFDPYNERDQSRNAYLASASEREASSTDAHSSTTDASQCKHNSSTKDAAEEEANGKADNADVTIMIANLPTFLEELHLMHICQKYGKVTSMVIQRDNNDNNLGCATVTFDSVEAKEAAQKGLDGCVMCNKTIVCH